MSILTRTYTFTDGTVAYGSQVNSEIDNIVNTLNSLDSAGTTWTNVKVTTLLPQADVNMNAHRLTSLGTPTTAGDAAQYPITNGQIGTSAVTFDKIASATIITGNIAASTITGGNIASATITGTNLASNIALPGTPTTSNASVNDSSFKIATTAFVNPANTLSATGYQEFASGLIMQWGPIPSTNGSGTAVTVTFPLVFPTAIWSFQASAANIGSGNGHDAWHISAISTSSCTMHNNDATTAFTGYYLAIGI